MIREPRCHTRSISCDIVDSRRYSPEGMYQKFLIARNPKKTETGRTHLPSLSCSVWVSLAEILEYKLKRLSRISLLQLILTRKKSEIYASNQRLPILEESERVEKLSMNEGGAILSPLFC